MHQDVQRTRDYVVVKYFEDIQIGDAETVGKYEVTEEEMVAFAEKWDPLPIHIDVVAANKSSHGGLIASGQYTLAVKQKLYTQTSFLSEAVIGGIGWDEVRFVNPVRPGHSLSLTAECIEKRASTSKSDRGVLKFNVSMMTQHDELVLSYISMVMVHKRQKG
jgi:acyl dehydratase